MRAAHLVNQQPAGGVAHAAQHADAGLDKAYVVHWLGQLDVAKVARAVPVIHAIGGANPSTLHASHAQIAEATLLWLALFIRLAAVDLSDGVLGLRATRLFVPAQKLGPQGAQGKAGQLLPPAPQGLADFVRTRIRSMQAWCSSALTISSGFHTENCTALTRLIGAALYGN